MCILRIRAIVELIVAVVSISNRIDDSVAFRDKLIEASHRSILSLCRFMLGDITVSQLKQR